LTAATAGDTIEFLLSPNRDLVAAKGFLRLALSAGQTRPRVINVDGHPAYASAIGELKRTGELGRNCRCRRSPYMNNIIEQDHRFAKKRVVASPGFRSADGAISSIAGYEAMNIIPMQSSYPFARSLRHNLTIDLDGIGSEQAGTLSGPGGEISLRSPLNCKSSITRPAGS
jgi:transposase-like protein